jgi:hypothetical protein
VAVNPRIVASGVIADLAIFVPVLVVYVIAGHAAGVAAVGSGLIAPLFGGYVAGRQPSSAPLTDGAASAGVVAVGYVIVRVLDAVVRNRPVHPASIIFLVIVATTAGCAGGWIGFRARTGARSS